MLSNINVPKYALFTIKNTHIFLRTRQIEMILININTSLRSRKILENYVKCDNSVNRGRNVLKTPLCHIKHVLKNRKEKDTAMFIIVSPVDNSK